MNVVVTAIGAVTPFGVGSAALVAGVDRASPIAPDGARVPDLDFRQILGAKGLRSVDRLGRLVLVACHEALAGSGLPSEARGPEEMGVVLGTAFSGIASMAGFYRERLADGPRLVTASNFGNIVMNAAASQVALRHGLTAVNGTITSGGAAGLDALGWALDLLRAGRAHVLLAGGADELSGEAEATLTVCGGDENGVVPGEAAVLWILEREADARARGADVLARVAGHASAYDPGALLGRAPDAGVPARAMEQALAAAGVASDAIDLVVTSRCGRASLDAAEAHALDAVLPHRPEQLAPKTVVGDTLGAAGVVGATLAVARLRTRGAGGARHALVLASGTTGHHAALVLSRGEDPA